MRSSASRNAKTQQSKHGNYADGYDLDDWLQAESDVDHMLVRRNPG
jgi:hypothetical protein